MPVPVVEPRPPASALRFGAPEEAQEASYLAASARMRSWCMAAMAFLGLAHTFKSGEMIRVGLLIDRLGARPRVRDRLARGRPRLRRLLRLARGALHLRQLALQRHGPGRARGAAVDPAARLRGGLVILFIAFVDELVHVLARRRSALREAAAATAEEVVERAIQSGV